MTPGFLRKADAAKYLSVSLRTLTNWQRRGVISFHKPCRKVTLFSIVELHRAMDRFKVHAIATRGQS